MSSSLLPRLLGSWAVGLAVVHVLFWAGSASADDPVGTGQGARVGRTAFAVWYTPDAPKDAGSLKQVLGAGDSMRMEVFSSAEAWAAADADVLVVRGSDQSGMPVHDYDGFLRAHNFELLKGRRVLGIGWEARRAFESLGLELDGATFERARADIVVQPGALAAPGATVRMEAFDAARFAGGKPKWDSETVHMPRWGALASKVEAVARWGHDDAYAPLVRQQNYLYCGIAADVRTWTEPFRAAVRDFVAALRARPLEPFALTEWEVTAPGSFEFTLTRGSDPRTPYEKEFFFRFEEPVLFSAELQQEGSSDTMLFFCAKKSMTLRDMSRLDGTSGETLRILIPITKECIRANGGRYWSLRVTNFDAETTACKLRIDYAKDAAVRFPDGLAIPMAAPPTDEKTIVSLIERFRQPDEGTRRLAQAALLIVGRAALGPLRAAEKTMKDSDERVRAMMLVSSIEGE